MTTSTEPAARPRRRWVRRSLIGLLSLVVVLIALVLGALTYFHIPSNAAGMAAKGVCSAAYVAGREGSADDLLAADVTPASVAFKVISATKNDEEPSVTARFLWFWSRTAVLQRDRGCVLDVKGDANAETYVPVTRSKPWPVGDKVDPPAKAKLTALNAVLDKAFEGSGDPALANARGVAVVQHGRLLALRNGAGITPGTALHGWSMTKTVAAMLAIKRFSEVGLSLDTPVVDAFPEGRVPAWVDEWRGDDRANITLADLLYMRSGLAIDESYDPTGDVVQMLYGEGDMAAWAASHGTDHEPGSYWEYLSADANLLAEVVRAQFKDDSAYWAYPRIALFDPLGIHSATLETDTSGTWVGSSYLWASTADWARLGQLMLDGGRWDGRRVLPRSFGALATTPALPSGEGHGYGAQTWLLGDPVGGECKDYPGVPADTVAMEGHWGQLVAAVPSRDAVVVRLGWTFNSDQFDGCQFLSDTLAALPR